VKIEKTLNLWYLEGTLPQLQKAKGYLTGLVVDMVNQHESEGKTVKETIENVTQVIYCAYLFFKGISNNTSGMAFLHYTESKQLVEIEGTVEETKKIKHGFDQLLKKCEFISLNISAKQLTVSNIKEKLGSVRRDQSHVYIHIHEETGNEFVDSISLLGFIKESVQEVKSQVFGKLGLATKRRDRFAKSDGARLKDSYSLQVVFGRKS